MRYKLLRHERRRLKESGSWTGGFGGTGVGLASAEQQIPLLAELAAGYWLTVGGVAAVGLGAVCWTTAFLLPQRYPRCNDLDIRDARTDEIADIHNRLAQYTGSALAPLDERLAIHERNPKCFQVIFSKLDQDTEIKEGRLIVYPLGVDAWRRIQAGEITGKDIVASDIVKRFSSAKALYISFAEGDDFSARGFVVEMIKDMIADCAVPLATRPTTREALALVKKLGLKQVNGDDPELNTLCWQEHDTMMSRAEQFNRGKSKSPAGKLRELAARLNPLG